VVAPDFPIVEVWRDYVTDQARLARARYLRVTVDLLNEFGVGLQRDMRIDTGAPFSIVPYSLWHLRQLSWQLLGTELYTQAGQLDLTALTWQGVPCSFGELRIRLVDEFQQRSRMLRLVAKLPIRPVALHAENIALLGCNFLVDNSLPMMINPARRTNAGIFTNIIGHLTVP
jgi:hypothetical protein